LIAGVDGVRAMSDVRYTRDHEWVRLDGDLATIGISEHAQQQLGDLVFVELPEIGKEVSQGGNLAVVESVKAASDVYAPLSGEVVETNSAIEDDPGLVNRSAEDEGWFCRLRMADRSELTQLMDTAAYKAYVAGLS
jgi:glycine cleavage system H protein